MKFTAVLLSTALSFFAIVSHADQASDIAKVRHMANQIIMGSDVKKVITVFDNTEGNPCAAEGISYVVEVQVRKSVMTMDAAGVVGQERQWQSINQYSISKDDLQKGGALSDALCQE